MKKTTILLIWNVLWATAIFILCALPSQSIPDPGLDIPQLDKIVHFSMFFIMALLLCYGITYKSPFSLKKTYLIVVSITFAYGGIIELLQYYVFNRSGDIWDLLADIAGAIAGCCFYPTTKRILYKIFPGPCQQR